MYLPLCSCGIDLYPLLYPPFRHLTQLKTDQAQLVDDLAALKAEVESFIGLGDLKQVDDRWGKTNLTFYLDPDPIRGI